jgi:hypothetical protein
VAVLSPSWLLLLPSQQEARRSVVTLQAWNAPALT